MGKISLSNIVDELAVKSGLTREASDVFLHAFIDTIEKGLQEDSIVKIKGLGTFKLQEVSDRGSVDVNTGERITIKGYRKVTFTPESAMKEFVNRPFAHFEPTELNDQYPADEEPILSDSPLDGSVDAEMVDKIVEKESHDIHAEELVSEDITKTVEVDVVTVKKEEDNSLVVSVPLEVESSEPAVAKDVEMLESADETVSVSGKFVEPISETEELVKITDISETVAVLVKQTEASELENKSEECRTIDAIGALEATVKKEDTADSTDEQSSSVVNPLSSNSSPVPPKRIGWGWIIILLFIVIAIVASYWYFTRVVDEEQSHNGDIEEYDDMMVNPNLEEELGEDWTGEPEVETRLEKKVSMSKDTLPESAPEAVESLAKEGKNESQTIFCVVEITESLSEKSIKDITPSDTTDYTLEGTLVTHELKSGETIILLAKKYYGDKRLWPYIVKYNWMKDFDNVAVGQMINIPILKNKLIE